MTNAVTISGVDALQQRLDSLSPQIAEPLRRAIEVALRDPEERDWKEVQRCWDEAMSAARREPR